METTGNFTWKPQKISHEINKEKGLFLKFLEKNPKNTASVKKVATQHQNKKSNLFKPSDQIIRKSYILQNAIKKINKNQNPTKRSEIYTDGNKKF